MVVGVVRRPAGYRGGVHRTAWTSSCGGALPAFPCPALFPSPPSPRPFLPAHGCPGHPSPACPWAPSLPHAPGSGALPPACPPASVLYHPLCHPRPCPFRWRSRPSRAPACAPCRALCASFRCRALACPVCPPSPAAACAGALPVPLPSLVAASALALPLCPSPGAAAPAFALWRVSSSSAYQPSSVALRPSPRASVAGTPPRPTAVPPILDHAPLQLWQRDARRRVLRRRGADRLRPPLGEGGLGQIRLRGAHVVVAGLGVGPVPGYLPAFRCGRGGPRRGAPGSRGACLSRRRRARGCGMAGRGGGRGPLRIWGPPRGRRDRSSGLGGGGGLPDRQWFQGRQFGVIGSCLWLLGWRPDRYCGLSSCRSSRSSGVSPAHPGETGERERTRRWWRSSCCREPSEAEILVIPVCMRGCRLACPNTSECIAGVPWAVPCGAGQAGGRGGGGGWLWWWFRAVSGQLPSTGTWAGGGRATRPICRATAPSQGWGSGPPALGGRRALPGGAAQGGPP